MYLRHPHFITQPADSGLFKLHAQLVNGAEVEALGGSEDAAHCMFREAMRAKLAELSDFEIAFNKGIHLHGMRPYVDADRAQRLDFLRVTLSEMAFDSRLIPLSDFIFTVANNNYSALGRALGVSHASVLGWVEAGDRYVVGQPGGGFWLCKVTHTGDMPAQLPMTKPGNAKKGAA